MIVVLRIIDRFEIKGRGTVYIVKNLNDCELRVGDTFFDLLGNHFKLKGIEMFRRIPTDNAVDEYPLGIMLEKVNGKSVQGNLLLQNHGKINFLFCSNPLDKRLVDDDYANEYNAVKDIFPCALFSYDAFLSGKLSLTKENISGLTIYRGWMMKPDTYRKFYDALEKHGIILINSPEEYEKYHLLPNWYNDFKNETIESIWSNDCNIDTIMQLAKDLNGSYVIKDYVKSRKHEWYDACFIKNINDKNSVAKILNTFIERQGSDLVGGIVIRKFENLKPIGYHPQSGMPLSEEYRAFVYAGQIIAFDKYWEQEINISLSDSEHQWIKSIAGKLKSNFVTVDFARKESGELVIMEFGDGQVSGLQNISPENFYSSFFRVNQP